MHVRRARSSYDPRIEIPLWLFVALVQVASIATGGVVCWVINSLGGYVRVGVLAFLAVWAAVTIGVSLLARQD